MERLTDAELLDIERWASCDLRESDAQPLQALVDEVRRLRQQALTADDREALRKAREIVMNSGRDVDRHVRFVLDRLLKESP